MKKYKVLHVSPTPLVDSPRKINDALNLYTDHISHIIIFNDYPGKLKNKFISNVIMFHEFKELSLALISEADIIHVHNFLGKDEEKILYMESKVNVKFIYQVHSPLREGPIFTEYATEDRLIKFHDKCVIAQYHPRLYPDYKLVPNIVLEEATLNLIKDDELPIVLFSPAHTRVGARWNSKSTDSLYEVLESIENLNLIELWLVNDIAPKELFNLRRKSHISIDEIITGSYHQVSLESLCCGNVTINNSDIFSDLMMKVVIGKEVEIPFFKIDISNFYDKLLELVKNKELIRRYQKKGFDFHTTYLSPIKLIEKYTVIYDKVLDYD